MFRTKKIEGVSVTIIAGAEAHNITPCLESVRWADEIIVLCSSRADATLDIAKQYTDHAVFREFTGYAEQKAAALAMATKTWVLSLDADERVTAELADEIEHCINEASAVSGFSIPRRNHLRGKWIRHAGNYPDYQMRLFRRNKTTLSGRLVHEKFLVDGKTARMTHPLMHYTNPDIRHMLSKNLDYAWFEALEKSTYRRASIASTLFRLPYEFFKKYILSAGFLDGWEGFVVSAVHAINKLQVALYMWELQHPSTDGEKEG